MSKARDTVETGVRVPQQAPAVAAAPQDERDREPRGHTGSGVWIRKSITVRRPIEEVYQYWRDLPNLPRFMRHLESVVVTGPRTSHWRASAPAGQSVEWDAEILEDLPNELIAWQSLEGAMIAHAGRVRFLTAPGGRGTEVHVRMRYELPGGKATAALAKLFHEEPGQQVEDDLYRFKQVMELGEVTLSDATVVKGGHPAQPEGPDDADEQPDPARLRKEAP